MREWKKIKIYKNYSVSNDGLVRNDKKEIELKQYKKEKYPYVRLYKDGKPKKFLTHILVLEYFLGKKKKGFQANHKDCNKFNNKIDNLEYLTASENMKHAYKNNRIDRTPWNKGKKGLQVAWNKGLKLSIKEIK